MRVAWLTAALLAFSTTAFAHIRVTPPESKAGAKETYTLRVPTEGKVTTQSVRLEVPDGVTVLSASGPEGSKHEMQRQGDRVVSVTWTFDIKPGEAAEFTFVAQNPTSGSAISWKAHQNYADGTSTDWVGPAGDRRPAAVTTLIATEQR